MQVIQETEGTLVPKQDKDGGYYAVKGFLYQFDTTIIKILENPAEEISFESNQDIDFEKYVIQVKHKETQKYTPSKIKPPIIQLLNLFKEDRSKKYCLYCYFKGTPPQYKQFSIEEINEVLGQSRDNFDNELKISFVASFIIKFSDDYEKQFITTLELIEKAYKLEKRDMALLYHSIIRSEIFRLVVKERTLRKLSKPSLDSLIQEQKQIVFYSVYKEYLTKESYERFIRNQFFNIKGPNLFNFNRLFIIDSSNYNNLTEIQQVIIQISRKYYRKDKSPAPIICFRKLDISIINQIKQELMDIDFRFFDGTYFDGDKFRIDSLIDASNDVPVRFINEKHIDDLLKNKRIHEVYQFFKDTRVELETEHKHVKIQIEELNQINQILA